MDVERHSRPDCERGKFLQGSTNGMLQVRISSIIALMMSNVIVFLRRNFSEMDKGGSISDYHLQ